MMLEKDLDRTKEIFRPGKNCWRINQLRHGSMLIDCADFYRAIHNSISKARRSIFIAGWEVDSTVRLLRGEEEKHNPLPSNILDLLVWKASDVPGIKIYILRWDSSVAFIGEREFLPEHAWTMNTPENINFCLDDTMPLGGCHHQKLILVDDEVVFSGGMDIARQRWDERDHRVEEPNRTDGNGPYGPYHDVQIVLDGPIVRDFAELLRWRWKAAAGYAALAIHTPPLSNPRHLSDRWPDGFPPVFSGMTMAIARTLPSMKNQFQVEEVCQMYLDLIATAEDFIYIENQYLTFKKIAEAINRRLHEAKNLKVLIISSHDPQGIFETQALWAGRIEFRKIAEAGIDRSRIRFCSSGIQTAAKEVCYKRIHSKILVVDDKYIIVGSANITNRSMALDTECDVAIKSRNATEAKAILDVRNDLIAEHSGLSIAEIKEALVSNATLDNLMNADVEDRYVLHDLTDEKFTTGNFYSMAAGLADPVEPFLAYSKEPAPQGRIIRALKNPNRLGLIATLVFIAVVTGAVLFIRAHMNWFTPASVTSFLETIRSSPWAFPLVCLVYIVGGFILFPVTALSLITAAVFGSIWGPIYGMCGALLSASLMFWIGHWIGLKGLRKFLGDRIRKIDEQFRETGIIGISVIRLLPIAPFSVVNIVAGISSVRFFDFVAGSFLGFLPAFLAKGIVGDSLVQVFLEPTVKTTVYLGVGILLWFLLVFASYYLAKYWQKRHGT